jgi:hypothetical protein
MTQNANKTKEITELVSAIAKHGSYGSRDISRLHTIAPTARLEIIELVDEADNNNTLRAQVERLEYLLQHDLRHRVTVQLGIVTHAVVDDLIATALSYGNSRLYERNTAKLAEHLDAMRHDLEKTECIDLYDVAVRYGLTRARRQRSAAMIQGTIDAIRALAE